MTDILQRLQEACVGHPHAKIPWPHRLLHDAVAEIDRLRQENDRLTLQSACGVCNGTEWVCEFHPDKPWGDAISAGPNACHCGGAGKPCPECNPLSKERRDDILSPKAEA